MTEALLEALGLKELTRAGWVRAGVPHPESVADHSWGVAWLTLVLLPGDLDLARALSYAVLHDLPEVRVGDITPSDGVHPADKHAAERAAMTDICSALPNGQALLATWNAYEGQADAEARFVRQLDKLDMALQAVRYGSDDLDLGEFLESAAARIDHPRLVPLMDALLATADPSAQAQADGDQDHPIGQGHP